MIYKQHVITNIEINQISDLHKLKPFIEEGTLKVNKSQIARELGKDRRTVDKYLKGYKRPLKRNRYSRIDDYYDEIKFLLSDETQQIFYYKRVLWQFLTDNKGLHCSESSFRRYLLKHKELNEYFLERKSAVSSASSHMRYETKAGAQAQLDWKESINYILKTGETVTVNVFVLLLSYSRFRVYRLSVSKNQDILFSFLNDAFETFGGVPSEVVTDNMKTVMDVARTEHFAGKMNEKFKLFADNYGFKTRPCIAGRPQTKSKVEAPMKLLDEIYAYNGLLDYEGLIKLVETLNNRVNSQVHKGTGKIPMFYFQKEKPFLHPLPKESIRKAYRITTRTPKVNASSMITYLSNQYSVPPKYIGKRLNLQVYDDYLHMYYNTELIAIHQLSNRKLNYLESHYVMISKQTLNDKYIDIDKLAKENLKQIGDVYSDEQYLCTVN